MLKLEEGLEKGSETTNLEENIIKIVTKDESCPIVTAYRVPIGYAHLAEEKCLLNTVAA